MQADPHGFTMNFIAASDLYRRQFTEPWQEVIANFTVTPQWDNSISGSGSRSPYRRDNDSMYRGKKNRIILKDFETHAMVMTYAARLMRALFGDPRHEYVQAAPVGWEDAATKAPTATRLMRRAFSRPGNYRSMQETVVDMIIFGTAPYEVQWKYCEREMPVRTVTSDTETGIEGSTFSVGNVPAFDDVTIRSIDPMDFYPDPSRYRIEDMSGAAKRFRMNAAEAVRNVGYGIFKRAGVEDAIRGGGSGAAADDDNIRRGLDQPSDTRSMSSNKDMIGYEYWGEVPWEKDGTSRRVITILNNHVVRDDPWPLADPTLPFGAFVINPMQGRFYGVSPAEVVRFDQSLADAMKILLAEATIRQVHPPIAVDPDMNADYGALKAWKADAIVEVRGGPASIGTLRYDANIQNGFAVMQGLKNSMQQGGGTIGVSGEQGPDREAASIGMRRIEFALDRVELAARLLEEDALPELAQKILRRYQQFIVDTDDLKKRIGELPEPAWIGDIMGDFDITFVGSRMSQSRVQKLQAYQTLAGLAQAIPALRLMLPAQDLARTLVGDILELPEAAVAVGTPETVRQNAMMEMMMGQGGGENGVATSAAPPGLPEGQAMGGVQ